MLLLALEDHRCAACMMQDAGAAVQYRAEAQALSSLPFWAHTTLHADQGRPFDVCCSARSYSGGRTADAFLEFLEAKLEQDRGFARVESLDKLASAFLTATDKTGASAALKAAAEKLDDVQRGAGELYAKFAEKASTKVCFCSAMFLFCVTHAPTSCMP